MNEDKFKLNMEILKNSSNKLKSLVEEIQECECVYFYFFQRFHLMYGSFCRRRLEKKTEEIKNMTAPHELVIILRSLI